MTEIQTAVLSAYSKMLVECDKAPRSVAKISAFSVKIARVREIVAEIQTLSPQHIESTKGNTKAKNNVQDELIIMTDIVASAIHSYADDKGDDSLTGKVNYNRTKLAHLGQEQLLEIAKVVLKNAQLIPTAELAERGISAEELTEYASLIDQFNALVPDNAANEVEKTAIGKRIRALFAELADIKTNHLNQLSKQLMRKDPDFYYLYKTTMIVRYPSSKKKHTHETSSDATT